MRRHDAKRRLAARGFTLLELMVGSVVTSIIMLAVAAAFIAAQASYQAETEIKSAVENGRSGLALLEQSLAMAGYGIEPRFAFDLAAPTGGIKDNQVGATVPAFRTDDLAFRYRDPSFLRMGTLAGANIALSSALGVELPAGQALMVACTSGAEHLMVKAPTGALANALAINILPYGAPFPTAVPPCLSSEGFVMLVREFRVRVVPVGGRPWLVAFRNLSADVSTSTDYDPIASDVENFQVAYVMNRPPPAGGCCSGTAAIDPAPGNSNWVLGDSPGETQLPDPAAVAPVYEDLYDASSRYTLHPANIRGVQISLGLRSARAEPNGRRGFPDRALENAAATGIVDGYYRTYLTTSVRTSNTMSRSFFVPSLRTAGDSADLNTWGG